MTINEIWIVAEMRNGQITRMTSQLIGVARTLAGEKSILARALLLGGEQEEANALARSIEQVFWVPNPNLAEYDAERYVMAIHQLTEQRGQPKVILAGAGGKGQEFMPRLAARLRAGYQSSCVEIGWSDDGVEVLRPLYGGKVFEKSLLEANPALLTVRAGAYGLAKDLETAGHVETMTVDIGEAIGMQIVEQAVSPQARGDLLEAPRVVAGGRGMGEADNFQLLEDLADTIGAAVGASRSVVDAGWRPHDDQVGKSGKTISPELYIACGISGAIHHVLGMNSAKTVVAINTDPDALIFQHADLGIVGDATRVLPELTKAVREARDKS